MKTLALTLAALVSVGTMAHANAENAPISTVTCDVQSSCVLTPGVCSTNSNHYYEISASQVKQTMICVTSEAKTVTYNRMISAGADARNNYNCDQLPLTISEYGGLCK